MIVETSSAIAIEPRRRRRARSRSPFYSASADCPRRYGLGRSATFHHAWSSFVFLVSFVVHLSRFIGHPRRNRANFVQERKFGLGLGAGGGGNCAMLLGGEVDHLGHGAGEVGGVVGADQGAGAGGD